MPHKDPERRKRYQREWIAQRRESFFSDKSCVRCGSTDRLELDHVDPSQKVSHRVFNWSEERRSAEIAKCQILCHDCHADKSAAEHAKGEDSGRAKLTAAQVLEIRHLWETGQYTKRGLGRQFNVDERNIRFILAEKTWRSHV